MIVPKRNLIKRKGNEMQARQYYGFTSEAVLEILQSGPPIKARRLAEIFGVVVNKKSVGACSATLSNLVKNGKAIRLDKGVYTASPRVSKETNLVPERFRMSAADAALVSDSILGSALRIQQEIHRIKTENRELRESQKKHTGELNDAKELQDLALEENEDLFPESDDPEKAMLIKDRKIELAIQDKQLDQISNNLNKLMTISSAINSEIEDQTTIISDVETKVEEANTNTQQITKKISNFMMQQSGGNRTYCIIISVLLLIVILLVWIILFG